MRNEEWEARSGNEEWEAGAFPYCLLPTAYSLLPAPYSLA